MVERDNKLPVMQSPSSSSGTASSASDTTSDSSILVPIDSTSSARTSNSKALSRALLAAIAETQAISNRRTSVYSGRASTRTSDFLDLNSSRLAAGNIRRRVLSSIPAQALSSFLTALRCILASAFALTSAIFRLRFQLWKKSKSGWVLSLQEGISMISTNSSKWTRV